MKAPKERAVELIERICNDCPDCGCEVSSLDMPILLQIFTPLFEEIKLLNQDKAWATTQLEKLKDEVLAARKIRDAIIDRTSEHPDEATEITPYRTQVIDARFDYRLFESYDAIRKRNEET